MTSHRHYLVLLSGCWLLFGPRSASADQFMMSAATHALIGDFIISPSAAVDLVLATEWIPTPEITLGMEAAILKTVLPSNKNDQATLSLRANPFARIRFGQERSWGYLKLGGGLKSYLMDGSSDSVFVLVGSAGYVVEPVELDIFFGFELTCELDARSELSNLTPGLGGMIGFIF